MTDPVMLLAVSASLLAALSLVLARVIPDEYDRMEPRLALSRRTIYRSGR